MDRIPTPLQYTVQCLKKQPWYILILLIFDPICTATFTVLPQYILKNIIYSFSIASSYEHLLSCIRFDVVVYFSFFVFSFFVWRLYDYYVDTKAFPQLKKEIILEAFFHTIQQTKSYFQKNFSGDIAEKVDDLQKNVVSLIKWFFGKIIFDIMSILSIACCLLYFNLSCGLVTIAWIISMILMSLIIATKISRVAIKWVNASSLLNGIFVDIFSNALIVKFFNNYKKELAIIDKETEEIKNFEGAINYYFFIAWLIYSFTFLLVQIASFYVLVQQYKFSLINASGFAFVWGMNTALVNVLWRVLRDLTLLPEYYFSVKESLVILFEKIVIADEGAKNTLIKTKKGEIVFDNITFGFEKETTIFKDLSVVIRPGEKIALVGHSGSGKTTFLNLLLRLYELQKGSITIDRQDIATISLESLYNNISIIPQDSGIFYRTIKDNITYACPSGDISKALLDDALDFASLKEFVDELPSKEDTIIGERGSTISGGQRQRIAIARAFLKNAPILILDEATSNLDSIVERRIQENLEKIMHDKTVFVVAHRLSTIKKMDRILVFEKGNIVQDGTHDVLLKQKGLYRGLWQMQSNIIQDFSEEF